MDVFIFGTLLHIPLLIEVSGDAQVASRITWAVRPGHKVSRVAGQVFPIMHADVDGVAEGVIVEGLDAAALARLDYYEKAFGYHRVEFSVQDQHSVSRKVSAYMPEQGRWEPAQPWDRDEWIDVYGELAVMTAQEAMAGIDDGLSPEDMGAQPRGFYWRRLRSCAAL